jgi:hypothetical protein
VFESGWIRRIEGHAKQYFSMLSRFTFLDICIALRLGLLPMLVRCAGLKDYEYGVIPHPAQVGFLHVWHSTLLHILQRISKNSNAATADKADPALPNRFFEVIV